jgi:hypothetical protein
MKGRRHRSKLLATTQFDHPLPFSLNMTSEPLFELYRSHSNGLTAFGEEVGDEDYDGPFLMSEAFPNFLEREHRLLVVGQETNGWHGGFAGSSEAEIRQAGSKYAGFKFGEGYSNLFFPYARELASRLTGAEIWMWTNLFKFGKESGKGAPSDRVNELELKHFDVLRGEIGAIAPTCVVFMTGPNYDHFLRQRIPDVTFSEMEEFTLRQLAKLSSEFLPEASYRIYHPGYGNRDVAMYRGTMDRIFEDYRDAGK